jgi:hypothetical protein
MLAYKDGPCVRLISRNAVDHTACFRELAAAIGKLRVECPTAAAPSSPPPSAFPAPTAYVCTMTEREFRRLRAELLRAREDLEQEREKVAYLTGEIAALRKRLPTPRRQAAAPTVGASRPTDPLERLFAAIRPRRASERPGSAPTQR